MTRVAFVGAGSVEFTRKIALHDIDSDRLGTDVIPASVRREVIPA